MNAPTDRLLEESLKRFSVHEEIRHAFPEVRIAVVIALGVRNAPSDQGSTAALERAGALVRANFGAGRLRDHPRIACWHEIYRRFGTKPTKYLCSTEALASRALKSDKAVPAINLLVDHYNALSLQHLVPIGGEDLDQLSGRLELRPAAGHESFDIADDPSADQVVVPRGEVVWVDQAGVTCRRWNWRQGRRTRLTESSRNAYFIVESVTPSTGEAEGEQIVQQLCEVLRGLGYAQAVGVVRL